MRNIPGSSLAKLASSEAIEPINIVAVKWGNSEPTYYSDKIVADVGGKILEMGTIDDSQRSDSSGTTGALTVKLDDVDGSLKTIFNNSDMHLKPVDVYQTFNELGLSGKFLVLSGQVSTPIVWNEGERTLSFDVVTKLEDREVGWSAEMGNFELVAQDLFGKPWPLVFGTVQHIPAMALQNIPTAFTTEDFLITEPELTDDEELWELEIQFQAANKQRNQINADIIARTGGLNFSIDVMDDPAYKAARDRMDEIRAEVFRILEERGQKPAKGPVRASVPLIPTVNITQPFQGKVRVGNNFFSARMNNLTGRLNCTPLMRPASLAANKDNAADQYYDIGTQVVIADDYPIEHVVSIVPGTVLRVWAMRSFNGLKKMAVVPPRFYTVSTKNYGGQTAVIVTVKRPLSTLSMEPGLVTKNWETNFGQYMAPHIVNQVDWEDQIYVTFQSSIGPNPVDIMEYLINTYTDNEIDTTSFDHVKTLLNNTPMNFMLAAQPNVLQFLIDIAYQARCVIFLRNDIFYLIFLPEVPTPVDTITEDDIIVDSMEVTTTSTESLVTKYMATYRPDYSPQHSEPIKVILRFNINKYGMHAESHDFTMFNTYYATEHAAVFWMIRKCNTWKIIKAKLLITKLNLEVFDAVTLSFDHPYVANQDVTGIITSCKYDSADHSVAVEIWTPVRLGEMVPYTFAWPAGLTKQDIFPTVRDIQTGSTSGTQGGQQLPPANADRNEVGRPEPGGGGGGLNGRKNWTTGPAYLGEEDQYIPPSDPFEQSSRYTPMPEGRYNSLVAIESPKRRFTPLEGYNPSDIFPVKILKFAGNENGAITYTCEQYLNGLGSKPTIGTLRCLQLDPDERIPEGTWAIGCVTKYPNPAYEAPPVPEPGDDLTADDEIEDLEEESQYKYDRFFQVPIWLG